MPNPKTPTPDQIKNLIERAVRKGGLTLDEGERLRTGLHRATRRPGRALEAEELHRRNAALERSVRYWKSKARAVETTRQAERTPGPPAERPPAPPAGDDPDALRRVIALAQRWMHIPAKRKAAASIFAVIRNKDDA
ncbi:hypothetical protein [Streptomyces nogalater]|uniref:Uncharacterized protein n=1 Tax=Streptomyces nogalater TaxID=38314 RepID=A0ABW0W9A2_STRNO